MADLYMNDRETFDSEYCQHNIIESVFATLKNMYRGCTRCSKPDNRIREISIHAICYDIEIVVGRRQKMTDLHRIKSQYSQRNRHVLCRIHPSGTSAPCLRFGRFYELRRNNGATWIITDRFQHLSCLWHRRWHFLLLGHTMPSLMI